MSEDVRDVTPSGGPTWLRFLRGPNSKRHAREKSWQSFYTELQWAGFMAIATGVVVIIVGFTLFPGLTALAAAHALGVFSASAGAFISLGFLARWFGGVMLGRYR